MKKTFRSLVTALAFVTGGVAFTACESETEEANNDEYYATYASITSSDSNFTNTSKGGTINFKASGGEVRIYVSCGTDWLVENSNSRAFTTYITDTDYLIVSAGQNLVESEVAGTITLTTAGRHVAFASITVLQNAYGAPEISVDTNEWNAPAVGGLTTEIGVEATHEWTFATDANWLTGEKTETGIRLTVARNSEAAGRTAEIVLTCTDGYNSDSATVSVTQDGAAYITISEEEIIAYAYEYSATVSVESNYGWDYTCDSDWVTVEIAQDGKSMTVTYLTNYGASDREAVLTITAGDGVENVIGTELKIIQEGCPPEKAFVLEYDLSEATSLIVQLPLESVTYAIINWGDGESEVVFSHYPSHKYPSGGIYTAAVNGEVGTIRSYYPSSTYVNTLISGATYLTAVVQWGDLGLTDMSYGFYGCTNLVSLPEGVGPFSDVTNFTYCFYDCSSLKELPSRIFDRCSNVTNFCNCFYNCTSLTTVPENVFYMCTSVTNFWYCFYNCNELVSAPSFEGLSAVTDFSDTFAYCSSLTNIPENIFSGCTAVTSFGGIFEYCSSLTNIPENIFSGCTAVTSVSAAFYNCYSLKAVPVSLIDDAPLVTSFANTFYGCSSIVGESPYTEVDVNGEKVKVHLYERENHPEYFPTPTSCKGCFYSCRGFTDYSSIPSDWR